MDEARNASQQLRGNDDEGLQSSSSNMNTQRPRRAESIASLGSSMAQHARTLVGQFNCAGLNERSGPILDTELMEGREDGHQRYGDKEWRDRRPNADSAKKAFAAVPRNHRVVDV